MAQNLTADQLFQKEIVDKKTLNSGKLEMNEINFLKKQPEGMKDLSTKSLNMISGDIIKMNDEYLKGEKTSALLNWATTSFPLFLDQM